MNYPSLKGEVSITKMLIKNQRGQKLRRTDITHHSIASNIFDNYELLCNKLNVRTAIPLSVSKAEVSLPLM